jgi:hypothetical protein
MDLMTNKTYISEVQGLAEKPATDELVLPRGLFARWRHTHCFHRDAAREWTPSMVIRRCCVCERRQISRLQQWAPNGPDLHAGITWPVWQWTHWEWHTFSGGYSDI